MLQQQAHSFTRMLIRLLSVFITCFLILLAYSKTLFEWMMALNHWHFLPLKMATLISTDITAVFTVPMKLAFFVSLALCLPYMAIEGWYFIKPGLYPHERHLIKRLLFFSIAFFYMGAIMAYLLFAPILLHFFQDLTPKGVQMWIDIRHYQTFLLQLAVAGGLIFQIPFILKLALELGWIQLEHLSKSRRYVIVIAFSVGMLLTPPDVLSQILLSIPIWGLFEITLFYLRWQKRNLTIAKH